MASLARLGLAPRPGVALAVSRVHVGAIRRRAVALRVASDDGAEPASPAADAPSPGPSWINPHIVLLLNGRLAMMGFAAGVAGELLTHRSLAAQAASAGPGLLLAAALVLAAATAAPLVAGEVEGDEVFGPFTPSAEVLNGKIAIAGLVALLAIEAAKGSALF